MSEDNIAVISGLYEAFGRGDVDAVLGGMDENIVWHEAEGLPQGGEYHGPQAVAENVFAVVVEHFDDFAVTPSEILADGERVVALVTYSGTAKESGKTMNMPGA